MTIVNRTYPALKDISNDLSLIVNMLDSISESSGSSGTGGIILPEEPEDSVLQLSNQQFYMNTNRIKFYESTGDANTTIYQLTMYFPFTLLINNEGTFHKVETGFKLFLNSNSNTGTNNNIDTGHLYLFFNNNDDLSLLRSLINPFEQLYFTINRRTSDSIASHWSDDIYDKGKHIIASIKFNNLNPIEDNPNIILEDPEQFITSEVNISDGYYDNKNMMLLSEVSFPRGYIRDFIKHLITIQRNISLFTVENINSFTFIDAYVRLQNGLPSEV